MGLLVDFSPDGMMDNDKEEDGELEAELIAIVGGQPDSKEKPKGKTPLPMEAIERMAALCMKDLDDEEGEEEEDLEDEDDLMAELNEVLGEEKEIKDATIPATKVNETPADSSSVESTLVERLEMYRTAIANAKQAGDSAKVRRYERGLKTLENMLTSVRKGKKIDEEEIPPAVALGKGGNSQLQSPSPLTLSSQSSTPNGRFSLSSHPPPQPPTAAPPQGPSAASPKPPPPVLPKPALALPIRSPEIPEEKPVPLALSGSENFSTQVLLQDRQREYKLAALHAKQQGSVEMASKYYRIAKSFDPILEALGKGETVDLGHLPPPADQLPKELLSPGLQQQSAVSTTMPLAKSAAPAADIPPPPRDMLEALQQRMERYKTASAQAKSKGDDRKARMHERIVKQYQEAIRAHKAGKAVDFAELPVPPGFPPIHGMEASSGDQSIMGVLETAIKLANQEDRENDEEDDNVEGMKKPGSRPALSKPAALSQPKLVPRVSSGGTPAAANPAGTGKSTAKATTKAQQQLAFLEGRKKQLMQAALRAKQKNDIEGAKLFLRQAKGLDPMIEASQGGLPVDITKVPQAPVNKEDFVLVQRRGVSISPEAASQYMEFMKLMRQQHEMCLNYSKQFTHLGNIAETTKFEKMAEDCKKNMEILKQAHAKGFPLPKYHYEQRTFSVVKIFPELNSNDMVLIIVKGINLPAPPGVTPNDLDAFVRFEFPHPNAEEAQKDKTNVIKNTDSPEFKEQFKLYINRGHRGLKRVFQTKGLKFEVVHKGFAAANGRSSAEINTCSTVRWTKCAHLCVPGVLVVRLLLHCVAKEQCLLAVLLLLDGRRPTGGKLEVIVRLREPLSSQQLETTTEKWLVIDPQTMPAVALPKPKPTVGPVRDVGNSKPIHTLHSLNVLAFDKEKLEKKVLAHRQAHRPLPSELVEQYQDVTQRSQWLKSQLQHGGPAFRKEYLTQLERFLQFYTESARRLGNEGNRDAAKEALYKRNLVESELQKFRR
ncbi:Coiled-coil and C2 domain-containing protein 1A [Chelonia mydas]|uniref:Coiled-coil and C2 domain-containing protein 1A n=1 Tax=Chelonia mydas TaxID=8469 RepID=M7B2F4_CHEMY|nr:Coiled-coil and C2 domain-containing protein 1A [Chelonia mydas]